MKVNIASNNELNLYQKKPVNKVSNSEQNCSYIQVWKRKCLAGNWNSLLTNVDLGKTKSGPDCENDKVKVKWHYSRLQVPIKILLQTKYGVYRYHICWEK